MSAKVALSQENDVTTTYNVTNSDSPTTLSLFDNISSSSSSPAYPSDAPSITPTTISPTTSIPPTISYDEICPNSEDWKRIGRPWEMLDWQTVFACDDDGVRCSDFGSLGRASLHCCKCRPMCCGRCNVPCTIATPAPNPPQDQPTFSPGYKYDYKDNSNSKSGSSSSWNFRPGPRHGVLVIVVFFVGIIFCCNREQRALRRTRRTMSNRRRQNSSGSENGGEISEERYQLFVSKFHFESVPPHHHHHHGDSDSNRTPINAPDCMVRENSSASSKAKLQDEEVDVVVDYNAERKIKVVKDPADLENSLKSVNSSSFSDCGSYRPFASLKRKPAKGECAICLDGYHPGETVCIAINEACNHIYHKECAKEWLKTNDRCPLCRVDLMKK